MKEKNSLFSFTSKKRTDIEITLPDGRTIVGPRGANVGAFLAIVPEWEGSQIVGAIVDGNLRELTFPLEKDAFVKPLNMSSSDGSKIYRRSLTFLLETAFEDLFPEYYLVIDHSVPHGGFYCKVPNRPPLSRQEIARLGRKMREYVKENLPILGRKLIWKRQSHILKPNSTMINCIFLITGANRTWCCISLDPIVIIIMGIWFRQPDSFGFLN